MVGAIHVEGVTVEGVEVSKSKVISQVLDPVVICV